MQEFTFGGKLCNFFVYENKNSWNLCLGNDNDRYQQMPLILQALHQDLPKTLFLTTKK